MFKKERKISYFSCFFDVLYAFNFVKWLSPFSFFCEGTSTRS